METQQQITGHKKKKTRFFETYISKVLKQVSDNNGITSNSKQQLNSALCIIARVLSETVGKLTEIAHKKTLSEKEVINALAMVLPGELSKNAIGEGTKAVEKFQRTPGKGSRQDKAGIIFPPSIAEKFLRGFGYSKIMVTSSAPVCLAAALEYITAEILELASNSAKDHKHVRITIRDIELGVRNDCELNNFFVKYKITFLGGGSQPFIHPSLLVKKNRKKKKISATAEPGVKKPHRFRPGTVSIREIRKFQKMSNCLTFAKFPFEKAVRGVVNTNNTRWCTMKISKEVFIVLQYFIEQSIVNVLRNANYAAIHAGRVKLMPNDINFVCAVQNGNDNPYSTKDNNVSPTISEEESVEESVEEELVEEELVEEELVEEESVEEESVEEELVEEELVEEESVEEELEEEEIEEDELEEEEIEEEELEEEELEEE